MQYKVPFVDPRAQFAKLKSSILSELERVLSRGNLILRDELSEFESKFARFVRRKYAIGVGSGFDALYLLLRSLNFKPTDEVISVSHTCIATISAIVNAGAKPVLVDVGRDFNMNMRLVANALTPNTKAVLPVHMNGRACDMNLLSEALKGTGVMIIEDAAQGLGARYEEKPVGTFGLAAAFSLYPFKMLGVLGDGGVVVTDDPELAQRIRVLRDYGEDRLTGEILCYGLSSRLDNIQAAIATLKLPLVSEFIHRRREIATRYEKALQRFTELTLPHFLETNRFDVFLNYTVLCKRRDDLARFLRDSGVEVLTPISFIKPLHKHERLGLSHLKLPETERISDEFVYLPIWPDLNDEQIDFVIDTIRRFFDRKG